MSDGNSAWRDNTIDNSSVRRVGHISSTNNAGEGFGIITGSLALSNDEKEISVRGTSESSMRLNTGIKYYNANGFDEFMVRKDYNANDVAEM
jgi:hypothetical protein